MLRRIYKILIIRFHEQYAIITRDDSSPQHRNVLLASTESAPNPEDAGEQPARTKLSRHTACNGRNTHPHPEKLMLQKLCFIGISARQAGRVFQRALAAAAVRVMCPLCRVPVGAGGPAFTPRRGTDALQTTRARSPASRGGGTGRRRRASPASDHSGEK